MASEIGKDLISKRIKESLTAKKLLKLKPGMPKGWPKVNLIRIYQRPMHCCLMVPVFNHLFLPAEVLLTEYKSYLYFTAYRLVFLNIKEVVSSYHNYSYGLKFSL
jgi:hypothetical protein